jgi:hypothetical protein
MVDHKVWYREMFPAFFGLLKYSFGCVYGNVCDFVTSHRLLVIAIIGFLVLVRVVRLLRWLGSR